MSFKISSISSHIILLLAFTLAGLTCANATNATAINKSMTVEPGTFKIGVEPWIGYGLWHVAHAKDFFKANGLDDVRIVNFNEDKDIDAALRSGNLDGASIALHTAIRMRTKGVPIHIVAMLDISLQDDQVIADKDIKSLSDLKGKKVAFEEGTTSDILLREALKSVGLNLSDIQKVPMSASSAGSALIAHRVPVVVTYEPYLTAARNADPSINTLYSAANDPGLISDVLAVRDEVIKKHPGQVLAMIKSWDKAYRFYKKHTGSAQKIIAKAIGARSESMAAAFKGMKYYNSDFSHKAFHGKFIDTTYHDVAKILKNINPSINPVSSKEIIDPRFVDALSH